MVSIFLVLQPLPGKSVNHRDNDMFRITRVGVLKLSQAAASRLLLLKCIRRQSLYLLFFLASEIREGQKCFCYLKQKLNFMVGIQSKSSFY